MKRENYRHGDVVIVKVEKKVDTTQLKENKDKTLALGEVTGHSHRFVEGDVRVFEWDEKKYIEVLSDYALLRHEEHHEIRLLTGTYESFIQEEWQEDGWTKVID